MIRTGEIIGVRQSGEPEDERDYFYCCKRCGQMLDKRDLGQVFHHEQMRHSRLPDDVVRYPAKKSCRTRSKPA